MSKLYDDLVMDHIRNARNYCALEGADVEAAGSNPLCGDEMRVYLRLDADRIAEAAFQCSCCGIAMASASMMTEMTRGRDIAEAAQAARDFVAAIDAASAGGLAGPSREQLALIDTVTRFPARRGCAALPWTTLMAAIRKSDRGRSDRDR